MIATYYTDRAPGTGREASRWRSGTSHQWPPARRTGLCRRICKTRSVDSAYACNSHIRTIASNWTSTCARVLCTSTDYSVRFYTFSICNVLQSTVYEVLQLLEASGEAREANQTFLALLLCVTEQRLLTREDRQVSAG